MENQEVKNTEEKVDGVGTVGAIIQLGFGIYLVYLGVQLLF